MPIYISSKGEQKDTETMPLTYLNNALRKAQEEGNEANIEALTAELAARNENATSESAQTDPDN